MPIQTDFTFAVFEDGQLTVNMSPPVAIGAWDIAFVVTKRTQAITPPISGGNVSGLIVKRAMSGYGNGVSGITILDSGQGQFRVDIAAGDTSGRTPGNYAHQIARLDSGSYTVVANGLFVLTT